MSNIRMLSESLIGKIAAGEVVERPASAMKELIENSLDAGATAVTAEIRDGGLTYLRVADNGSGIDSSDIRMLLSGMRPVKYPKSRIFFPSRRSASAEKRSRVLRRSHRWK